MDIINDTHHKAWLNGLIGVAIFSGSLPATRLAIADFDPVFLTVARASIAGILALLLLWFFKEKRPDKSQMLSLVTVALGVVVGFPLLTAWALQTVSAAHSIVFLALLPLSTAIFAVLRGGEKPKAAFWFFSILGSVLVMGFSFSQGIQSNLQGDGLMLLSIIVCGFGYAEGAKLSRDLGGWQVISWALVLSLPLMLVLSMLLMPDSFTGIASASWLGLGYVSVFSMLVGFIFWYKGLAQGGIASIGQLQLLQPFMGLGLAFLVLGEVVNMTMLFCTIAVIFCVAASKKFSR